jgi:hypothetical protein
MRFPAPNAELSAVPDALPLNRCVPDGSLLDRRAPGGRRSSAIPNGSTAPEQPLAPSFSRELQA